ncbi:4-(cytidine 5'-diphospho)-2-C-methyl-D-erythritol kinase [Kitasatospora atroaurantiaca]|uniref:4-diphosphocytidyl-2-C-methyl-D-erythritol kinase n=1 Tax=Kitasatospora atroaurantiaca TaxID=285545 RepID=A0A561EU81_9ACTN|nr:4-(cytidine 5'-diphospho)-2-C-methyl-D-erythritol kinase [Kitasatospora atroaurantiaca]TWE19169.1 4-diphosphocytidyl-2-C-methyl-D-erythritol kinase [Kitasatospora atroaurantiaca]
MITVRVPAKVNVQLGVGGLRADGFHDLANVFFAVALGDEVTATPGEGVTLSCTGPDAASVPLDDTNLAARAARLLAAHHGIEPGVHLHIAKSIPVAGGMAGGSADGAAALVACDALWGLNTPMDVLLDLAAELGSDVPFALIGGVALGRGRGEILEPLPVTGTFHWVFAVADGGLSTPAVFRECDRLRDEAFVGSADQGAGSGSAATEVPTPDADAALLAALADGDPAALAAALTNDLQPAALSLRPALADTLRAGTDAGAIGALVSGSGPTCAFLAKDAEAAAAIAKALTGSGTCRTAHATYGPVPGAQVQPGV